MTARHIVESLRGQWSGNYGLVPCPVSGHGKGYGDRSPSLKVWDGPEGVCVHCFAGCDWRDVKDVLRRQGQLPEFEPGLRRHLSDMSDNAQNSRLQPQEDTTAKERHERALAIWREAKPIAGTPAERYLRARDIDIELPSSLRYHAAVWYWPTELLIPAMIAAARAPDGTVHGIHMTFIRVDGRGKANVTKSKLRLGSCPGGAVRLGPAGANLGLCEGIETGLSCTQLNPGLSVWAGLSVSNLGSVVLPPEVKILHLFLDGDEPDSEAAKRAARASVTHMNAGRKVQIHRAPIGKDWNDVLQEDGSVGVKIDE